MKKIVLFLVMSMQLAFSAAVVEAAGANHIADTAGLLSSAEKEKLEEQFDEIAEAWQVDVAVLTTDSLWGKTPSAYTEDYYEANGYGYGAELDGIMLMVSMEDRDYWIATYGSAQWMFTDNGLLQLEDTFLSKLSSGDYSHAFRKFGETVDAFIREAKENRPYDVDHTYHEPMPVWLRFLIALAIGAVTAGIVLAVLFHQLRTVRIQREAREYVRDGSFHITRAIDLYLYRTVHRKKIEREQHSGGGGGGSSTHTTSSGRSAGGHGGKF